VHLTAPNHQEYIGRVWIKPGITANEDIFLKYNLVTVERSVNDITIRDEYEIVLTATYETEVPAPVVVIEPAAMTLPPMQARDVLNGEYTLTNFGLVKANNLGFGMPRSNEYFRYEYAEERLPTFLAVKGRVTIPCRVTCLKPLEPYADGTGGGSSYLQCTTVTYEYCYAAGHFTTGSERHCWFLGWCSNSRHRRRISTCHTAIPLPLARLTLACGSRFRFTPTKMV
jgi:hypothetical protein